MSSLGKPIISAWVIAGAIFHLWTGVFGVLEAWLHRLVHLTWVLPMAFIFWPSKIRVLDWFLVVLSILPGLYGLIYFDDILFRVAYVDPITPAQLALGLILILVLIEATRRLLGWSLTIIAVIFLLYMFVGDLFPGVLRGRSFSLSEVVESLFLTTDGIFSIPLGISSTYVIIFLIFGAFLEVSGVGSWFMSFATRISGKTVGGPAKVAVLSSCLFGTISGSAVANVYSTGSFTIPMMKRVGFKPYIAGAIETMASTGGQITPPLMGAGAFIMASYLGVPFKVVMLAAVIPAFLYYLTALFIVHYLAKKDGFRGMREDELPTWSDVLRKTFLLTPIIVLVTALMIGKSPTYSGIAAIFVCFLVSFLNRGHEINLFRFIDALIIGGKSAPVISVACAAAGIVIGSISLTGVGFKMAALISVLSGGVEFLALVLIAMLAIIFGMGLPTTSAYIIAAALGVGTLTSYGFSPLAAHMFIFYFAVLSNMTPPVALAAFAAATIAKDSPNKIALHSMRVGVVAFLIPFAFVYDSSLMMDGSFSHIIWSLSSMVISGYTLSVAFAGYMDSKISLFNSVILIIPALLIFFPFFGFKLMGMVVSLVLLFWFRYNRHFFRR